MINLYNALQDVLLKERRNKITFLTGAGLSAESGIPTYRGSDGIWVKGTKYHKPEEFGTFRYFKNNPEEVWQYTLFRKKMFENAQPNKSHELIVELETLLGDRFHLITQNIDNLHHRAGSKNMFEIHGNYREVKCSGDCRDILPLPQVLTGKDIDEDLSREELDALSCPACGQWLRPNLLWFDEYYDEKTHKKFSALQVAKNTGILFVLGTSGATNLPLAIARTTLRYGGYVVDVNIEDNQFTNLLKDKKRSIFVRQTSSAFLPLLLEQLQACINH